MNVRNVVLSLLVSGRISNNFDGVLGSCRRRLRRNVGVSACGVSEDLILRYVNTHVNIAVKQCRDDAARPGGLLNEKEKNYIFHY